MFTHSFFAIRFFTGRFFPPVEAPSGNTGMSGLSGQSGGGDMLGDF